MLVLYAQLGYNPLKNNSYIFFFFRTSTVSRIVLNTLGGLPNVKKKKKEAQYGQKNMEAWIGKDEFG